jgi:hypothetical protein
MQKMMAALYDVTIPAVNRHLKLVFADNEPEEAAVVKQYLITATDSKSYNAIPENFAAPSVLLSGGYYVSGTSRFHNMGRGGLIWVRTV